MQKLECSQQGDLSSAEPKLLAFITHGGEAMSANSRSAIERLGMNSVTEASFAGVPVSLFFPTILLKVLF